MKNVFGNGVYIGKAKNLGTVFVLGTYQGPVAAGGEV